MTATNSSLPHKLQHRGGIGSNPLFSAGGSLIHVGSRRWFLQAGLAGPLGLVLSNSAARANPHRDPKAVIVFWLSGGPSQIDTWDPKPHAPAEIRGPYRTISTSVPGIRICEHLPLQARIMNKLTIVRSVDCSASNHTPITMQSGNALARRTDDGKDGDGYPSMGSLAAKLRGPNDPSMPAFIGLADSWKSDVWGAGHLGGAYQPVKGNELPGRLAVPTGLNVPRLRERVELRQKFDTLERSLDVGAQMGQMDQYAEMAMEMVASPRVRRAFDLESEDAKVRDAYGRTSVGQKALLARRLVEAGTTFVLVSGKWGYFDHHGDTVPPWGGIQKGLTPILPTIDSALSALVEDLSARGLLDSTLILMMGEFGRSPVLTKDGGREHWLAVMSMLIAGGGLHHSQVIGSTDDRGGAIKSRRVTPSDLAATVFRHLEIPLDSSWMSPQGRPVPIVTQEGQPIRELG